MTLVNYDSVVQFLSFLRVRTDLGPGQANILGLRGMVPSVFSKMLVVSNTVNFYNDTILVAYCTESGQQNLLMFLGTVDPGSGYIGVPGGQAHLTDGQHLYVRGTHMGRPAFRAFNEVNRIWRDPDQNNVRSPGDSVYTGYFGINIHAGSATPKVGKWSAGCVNICGGWEGPHWQAFYEIAEKHLRRIPTVGVTIWEGKDYVSFVSPPGVTKPTLFFGMLNPWVQDLQEALAAKGYYSGKKDGDWQAKTEAAVRNFQQTNGLEADGIVGPATWSKLESF